MKQEEELEQANRPKKICNVLALQTRLAASLHLRMATSNSTAIDFVIYCVLEGLILCFIDADVYKLRTFRGLLTQVDRLRKYLGKQLS